VIQTKKSRTNYDKAFKQRAVALWLTSLDFRVKA
jgi:transposase-like protein